MSHLQIIEALCGLVEQQSDIIRKLEAELEQQRALTDAEQEAINAANARYSEIIGDGEVGV